MCIRDRQMAELPSGESSTAVVFVDFPAFTYKTPPKSPPVSPTGHSLEPFDHASIFNLGGAERSLEEIVIQELGPQDGGDSPKFLHQKPSFAPTTDGKALREAESSASKSKDDSEIRDHVSSLEPRFDPVPFMPGSKSGGDKEKKGSRASRLRFVSRSLPDRPTFAPNPFDEDIGEVGEWTEKSANPNLNEDNENLEEDYEFEAIFDPTIDPTLRRSGFSPRESSTMGFMSPGEISLAGAKAMSKANSTASMLKKKSGIFTNNLAEKARAMQKEDKSLANILRVSEEEYEKERDKDQRVIKDTEIKALTGAGSQIIIYESTTPPRSPSEDKTPMEAQGLGRLSDMKSIDDYISSPRVSLPMQELTTEAAHTVEDWEVTKRAGKQPHGQADWTSHQFNNQTITFIEAWTHVKTCLLYTSPSPRDQA
eukprot:TRINITY_DN9712_c0_g1_i7.p1 TRINITY_DN9712_c0_g1~~TRINITY_DN9712_c0_g1_i7.p1  ORF type:complete len:445 (-),score=75.26 TRINITY_DN9712_c0_g1_i7:35-1309(-)